MDNGFESISYLGTKIWEILPQEIQELSLLELKFKTKSWNPMTILASSVNCMYEELDTYDK